MLRHYQIKIDQIPYPEIFPMQDYFSRMAEWYWRANDASSAVKAQQQAIEVRSTMRPYSGITMKFFETRLAQYQVAC